MLIDKPITKNEVVSLKLITGEEMIAAYIEEDSDTYTVGKPATIGQGPQGIGIIPWMITSKAEKITLNKSTVIAMAVSEEEIAKSYSQATTDIQLVT